MKVLREFRDFINRGNVVDLAVAVVIGGAFGKIVSALVADLVMPLVNAVLPQGDWRKWEVSPLHFRIGDFLGVVVDFTIVAFVVFLVMVKVVGAAKLRKAAEAPPPTKTCPECLELVPAAARRCRACTSVLTAVALLLALAGDAWAQAEPKWEFGKPEAVKAVEWKVQAKGGFLLTTGNSQTQNGNAALSASRKAGGNKLSLDGAIVYGRSNVLTPVFSDDPTMPNSIIGLDRTSVVSTNNWLARGRYDRFFTTNNAAFATAQAAADKVAGKTFFGGGQLGYSRQLWKTDLHLGVAELGYDFSYESYVQQPGKTNDAVSIHSARAFVSETVKLSPASGATASVEALFNLNREASAMNVETGTPGVDAFKDTRVIGKLGTTTTLRKALSVAFSFTVRYDQNPALRPVPSGAPTGSSYAATFTPFAAKTDTITEATLIYTFL
jgi:large conductance mechanosensitive channel